MLPKKLFFVILMLGIFSGIAFSQTATEKKKELENVKKELNQAQKKAAESEAKRKKAVSSKKTITNQLTQTKKKAQELQRTESLLKKDLNVTKSQIDATNKEIANTVNSTNKSLNELLYMDNRHELLSDFCEYRYPLAIVISNSNEKYKELSSKKNKLIDQDLKTQNKVKNVSYQTAQENKKIANYAQQSSNIDKDIAKYEREKKQYQQKVAKLKKDAQALQSLIAKLTPKPEDKPKYTYTFPGGGLDWPLRGRILRSYGTQTHEKYNVSTMNNGLDIAADLGSSVKASASGEVVFAERFSGSGLMIIVDHKNGFHTVYGNNSQLLVAKGTNVTKGQIIAQSGTSSSLDEACLHFELRKNGKPVDPASYLK